MHLTKRDPREELLEQVANFIFSQKPLAPEYQEIVDREFWNLLLSSAGPETPTTPTSVSTCGGSGRASSE